MGRWWISGGYPLDIPWTYATDIQCIWKSYTSIWNLSGDSHGSNLKDCDIMAKILKIPVIGDMKGKVGQVVVRRRDGKYYVATPPIRDKDPTDKQLEHQKKFKRAIRYARRATDEDSPSREAYEEAAETVHDGRTPMNLAVADWFHPPEIDEVDFGDYHGKAGDKIFIYLNNDAKVKRVWMVISDGDGTELERGEATRSRTLEWFYTTTVDLPGEDATFVITIRDLPGNTSISTLDKHMETNTAMAGLETGSVVDPNEMNLETEPVALVEEEPETDNTDDAPDEGLEGDDAEPFPEDELETEA